MSNNEATRIRVFLADDLPVVRRGIALLLAAEPDMVVVGEAGGCWKVVDRVERLRPDLVLLDLDMPGLPTLDAIRRITEVSPGASVLLLTLNDTEDSLSQALLAGASGYVLKSATVEELVGAIRLVHAGETFIHPSIATRLVGQYIRRLRNGRDTDEFQRLSTREREVLPLIADGRADYDIASTLHISPYTVQTYRQRIMKKLDVHSRTELLKYALRKGIVSLVP